MKSKLMVGLSGTVAFLMLSSLLLAHHSVTWAERGRETKVTGTVVEFNFTNPHIIMIVTGKIEGDPKSIVQRWTVETTAPARAIRAGWTKSTFKAGDEITVIGARSKDGKPLMDSNKFIVNGKEVTADRDDGYVR